MTASLACFNRFQIRSQRGRNTGNTLDIKTHSDVHAITPTTAAVRINMKKVRSAPTITITSPSLSSTAASRLSPRFSISSTASDVLEVAHRGLTGLYVYKNSTFQLRNSRLSSRQLRSAACPLINGDAGKVIRFSDDGLTPFPYGQRFARVDVLEGKPVFKVTTGDKTNGINAGFWESSQGK